MFSGGIEVEYLLKIGYRNNYFSKEPRADEKLINKY